MKPIHALINCRFENLLGAKGNERAVIYQVGPGELAEQLISDVRLDEYLGKYNYLFSNDEIKKIYKFLELAKHTDWDRIDATPSEQLVELNEWTKVRDAAETSWEIFRSAWIRQGWDVTEL